MPVKGRIDAAGSAATVQIVEDDVDESVVLRLDWQAKPEAWLEIDVSFLVEAKVQAALKAAERARAEAGGKRKRPSFTATKEEREWLRKEYGDGWWRENKEQRKSEAKAALAADSEAE